MSDELSEPLIVVDTNVLLNLATPVVDGRSNAPTGEDPLRTVLTIYDVHIPSSVLGEVSEATIDDDLLSAAAETVLKASRHLTTHDITTKIDDDAILKVLSKEHGVASPKTAKHIAGEIGITVPGAHKRLNQLAGDGRVIKHKLRENIVVWSRRGCSMWSKRPTCSITSHGSSGPASVC